jgi:hypothetical protein
LKAAILFAAALAWAGAANAEPLAEAFGNTISLVNSGGQEVRYHFNADHTYVLIGPDGASVTGAWTLSDGQLCVTPQGGAPACGPYTEGRQVGDTWRQAGPDGSEVTVTLAAGR